MTEYEIKKNKIIKKGEYGTTTYYMNTEEIKQIEQFLKKTGGN